MGRFIQPDTFDGLVTDPATLNRYMYAANNPLKFATQRKCVRVL